MSNSKYVSKPIKTLPYNLRKEFGKGFLEDTLKNARKFYPTCKERISETEKLDGKFAANAIK